MHILFMLPLRVLFASLLLASSAQAYVYLDSWLDRIWPTVEDTMVITETTYSEYTTPRIFTLTVDERDANSRPQSASFVVNSQGDVQRITIDYQWGFDLDFSTAPIVSRCPSRFVINNSGHPYTKSDTNWYEWNPATRTLLHRSNNGMLMEPDCPWSDSIVLDSRNRVVFQAACGEVYDAYPEILTHRQFVRYWYEDSSNRHPRSASARIPDLDWFDTLAVVGPIERPYAMNRFRTTPTESSRSVDSLEWNSGSQLTRRTTRKGNLTSVYTNEFNGERLLRHSARYWQGDSLVDSLLKLYSYTLAGTGVSRHSAYLRPARFVSINGLLHLRIDLSAQGHVRVERISLDGKRLAILADKNLPAGRSLLPIFAKAGELVRLRFDGTIQTLVVPGVR